MIMNKMVVEIWTIKEAVSSNTALMQMRNRLLETEGKWILVI